MDVKIIMHYFGTNLDVAGHYFWILDDFWLSNSKIGFKDIPFNPENLTEGINGTINFFNIEDYTVLAIQGSCFDKRIGCHSVFWLQEKLDYDEMKERILEIPIAKKIINAMPFDVLWEN